jgi:hypothetical protein
MDRISLSIGDVWGTTQHVLGANLRSILLACACVEVPFTLIDLLFVLNGSTTPGLIGIVQAVARAWLYAVIVSLTMATLEQRTMGFGEAAAIGRGATARVFGVLFVQGLGVGLGTMCFFVPGILVWIWTSLAVAICVHERTGTMDAIQRSTAMTIGHRSSIFLLGLSLMPFVILIIMIAMVPALLLQAQPGMTGAVGVSAAAVVGVALMQSAYSVLTAAVMAVAYARIHEMTRGVDAAGIAEIMR